MFTGLIETTGTVVSVDVNRGAAHIGIRPDGSGFSLVPGASVSIDGVCLTLEHARGKVFCFTAVAETLGRTTLGRIKASARVNLERSMRADGRFDGHFVLGHVDGIGTIVADQSEGAGILRTVRVPENCVPLLAEKGSVAIDGISLTIAKAGGDRIALALIPATLGATTMSLKLPGDAVNIECDVLARYIYGICDPGKGPVAAQKGGVPRGRMLDGHAPDGHETLLGQMERAGF